MTSYDELGLRRVVNAMGAVTFLGGLPLSPTVRASIDAASAAKVDAAELLAVVGRRIAEITGAESATVTSGAAAGWQLSAAACIAGTDRRAIAELPQTHGIPDEVLIHRKHRGNFDHALRAAGARLVNFGYSRDRTEEWELESAIGERTAAVAYVTDFGDDTVLPLQTTVDIAHRAGIPVIVDAACSLPPADNLTAIVATGADLVSFSGGKALAGPQGTGFVVGRGDLVAAVAANTSPHHNTVGRAMKVSAENIVGLLTALEEYIRRDHAAEATAWVATLEALRLRLLAVAPEAVVEERARWAPPIPTLRIPGVRDVERVVARLAEGNPSVRVAFERGDIVVNPHALAAEDLSIVEARLLEELGGAS